jgi:hypothetical protein
MTNAVKKTKGSKFAWKRSTPAQLAKELRRQNANKAVCAPHDLVNPCEICKSRVLKNQFHFPSINRQHTIHESCANDASHLHVVSSEASPMQTELLPAVSKPAEPEAALTPTISSATDMSDLFRYIGKLEGQGELYQQIWSEYKSLCNAVLEAAKK